MAVILEIADAVVAALNGGAFSQPLVAVRHYQPCFELSEMTELRVSVVPRSVASKALDRNRHGYDYRIDVAVQRKVEPSVENLDALMELVQEIADHVRAHPLAGFPQARCRVVKNEPIYFPDHRQVVFGPRQEVVGDQILLQRPEVNYTGRLYSRNSL